MVQGHVKRLALVAGYAAAAVALWQWLRTRPRAESAPENAQARHERGLAPDRAIGPDSSAGPDPSAPSDPSAGPDSRSVPDKNLSQAKDSRP